MRSQFLRNSLASSFGPFASRIGLSLAAPLVFTAGCSGDPAVPSGPPPYAPPPASTLVDESPVKIRREVFTLAGIEADPNPTAGDSGITPADKNALRVVRYRVDADPPRPARAIAVLMPGFLGGAGSYEPMARAIVRRSQGDEAFEAWAIDRRSNLLEDHHGLDVAEVRRDPELGIAYYFEGEAVEGKTFPGFVQPSDVPYLSEWGLATTLGDLRKVIELVAAPDRKSRIVLVGHSLGASIAEAYAAWDFNGSPGYSDLAGLVLVDGISGEEGDAAPSLTEDEYLNGSGSGFTAMPGLDAIRASTPYIALPLLGLDIYPVASVTSMRSQWKPDEIIKDFYRNKAFQTLLSLGAIPDMTNRAAMGFAFDNESNGVSFAAVSCGTSKGGAVEKYTSLLGPELVHPVDTSATYDWIEFDATDPREATSIDDLARSWYDGPGLDFAEWYFPARLPLDAAAAKTLILKEGDWPLTKYGLRAMHGASMDLPIFGAVAGLIGTTDALAKLRALVDAVPIGPGRPLAGTPRTDENAFKVLDVIALTHIDPLSGSDSGGGLVPMWYDSLVQWMTTNTPPGGVTIPVAPPGE
ncbi:MAG: alpha/beta fold hydrolase [Polyangiaceae bacterium]|nr:alpha/beta fold hydrolase [Polyangiaceae bacterium]